MNAPGAAPPGTGAAGAAAAPKLNAPPPAVAGGVDAPAPPKENELPLAVVAGLGGMEEAAGAPKEKVEGAGEAVLEAVAEEVAVRAEGAPKEKEVEGVGAMGLGAIDEEDPKGLEEGG